MNKINGSGQYFPKFKIFYEIFISQQRKNFVKLVLHTENIKKNDFRTFHFLNYHRRNNTVNLTKNSI